MLLSLTVVYFGIVFWRTYYNYTCTNSLFTFLLASLTELTLGCLVLGITESTTDIFISLWKKQSASKSSGIPLDNIIFGFTFIFSVSYSANVYRGKQLSAKEDYFIILEHFFDKICFN